MTDNTTQSASGGILGAIASAIAAKLLPKLVELLWPRIVDLFEEVLLPKMVSMFPLFAASITKAVVDNIPGVDLLEDVGALADRVRDQVNVAVPDFDIPGVSEHFDMTEFINNILRRQ